MEVGEGTRIQLRIVKNLLRRRIDRLVLFPRARWAGIAAMFALFFLRMLWLQGFYASAYILGFYVLQNVILFMTPSGIPTIQDEENGEHAYEIPEAVSPTRSDASKPVIRKLGEFMLWKKLFLGVALAIASTFFPFLDFPVFWPLLLIYFLFIVASIAFKQHRHMRRHGYSFADFFKRKEQQF